MSKNGVLIYDERQERFDIRFGLEEYYGGLHCGENFEVEINGTWKSTRIEMAFGEGLVLSIPVDRKESRKWVGVRN